MNLKQKLGSSRGQCRTIRIFTPYGKRGRTKKDLKKLYYLYVKRVIKKSFGASGIKFYTA